MTKRTHEQLKKIALSNPKVKEAYDLLNSDEDLGKLIDYLIENNISYRSLKYKGNYK